MRKKLFICICLIVCLIFGGCGNGDKASVTITPKVSEEEKNASVSVSNESENPESSQEESNDETDDEDNDMDEDDGYDVEDILDSMFSSKASIEETVLLDWEGAKITATGLDYDDYDATLHLTIENNSDQDLSFYSGTLGYSMNTVNGYVVPVGYLNVDVMASMKAIKDITFDKEVLLGYGISDIAEIGMAFYIQDSDNKELLRTDLLTIKTSIYDKWDQKEDTFKKAINDGVWEKDLDIKVLYEDLDFNCSQDGLNINAVVIAESKYESTTIYLELENTTDERVAYSSKEITLNGITVTSGVWDSYYIPAHKRIIADFKLDYLIDEEYESLLNKDQIGSLSFTLKKFDIDTYNTKSESTVSVVFDESLAKTDVNGTSIYEANGISLYLLPITEDDFNMYYYVPIYIKNRFGAQIGISLDSDYFAIGGYMVDTLCFSEYVDDGSDAVMKIEIRKEEAKKYGINSIADFDTASCRFDIKNYDKYAKIDNPTVELVFK